MQKNKSFQKTAKSYKEISNSSSRALLELSQITVNSKDKSALMQNFTERSGYPALSDKENLANEASSTNQQ